jgi:hypothetical protein
VVLSVEQSMMGAELVSSSVPATVNVPIFVVRLVDPEKRTLVPPPLAATRVDPLSMVKLPLSLVSEKRVDEPALTVELLVIVTLFSFTAELMNAVSVLLLMLKMSVVVAKPEAPQSVLAKTVLLVPLIRRAPGEVVDILLLPPELEEVFPE